MKTEYFLKHIEQTFIDCLQLVRRKNQDYANSGDPFKNFNMSNQVGVLPARGILVRVSDKISRISNLLDRPAAVENEAIEDTINDAINYLAILSALLRSYRTEDVDCGVKVAPLEYGTQKFNEEDGPYQPEERRRY